MLPEVLSANDNRDSSKGMRFRSSVFTIVKYMIPFLLLVSGCLFFRVRNFTSQKLILQPTSSALQSSPDFFDSRTKIPPSLMHGMSDEELFRAASIASQVQNDPSNSVQKVAFMFLTRGPLPLSPLWEKFFRGNEGLYSIYVHSLPTYRANYPPDSVFYKRQIPSQVAEWGKMSMCDAERRLLGNALLDTSNRWFVLLSESCIPLHTFCSTYTFLNSSPRSFVGCFDDPGVHGRGRYNPQMSPLIRPHQWRKGSQWFEVGRELALFIVQDARYYQSFKEFCRPPCYVDEHYFPTMLHVERPGLIANRSVTYADWSRGGPHPATFGMGDVTEDFLKSRIPRADFLFARKFAPAALEKLLRLAPAVFGYG